MINQKISRPGRAAFVVCIVLAVLLSSCIKVKEEPKNDTVCLTSGLVQSPTGDLMIIKDNKPVVKCQYLPNIEAVACDKNILDSLRS